MRKSSTEPRIAPLAELSDDLRALASPGGAAAFSGAEPALLELVMLVGFYRMLAGVLNAARIQPEPGAPSWPEGTAQEEMP